MSERIWKGRCEDCYDEKKLQICSDNTIPAEMSAELCEDCIAQRRLLQQQGLEPPHIGLLMRGVWKDAQPLVVIQNGRRINVSVKFLTGAYGGIVRLRFNEEPKWLAAGVFGTSEMLALSEAKHFLRETYFNNAPISFE